jgi:aminopeptidase YwaD
VRELAETIGSRPAGSPNDARAADYIAARLASFGFQVEKQPFTFTGYVDGGSQVRITAPESRDIEATTLIYSAAGDVTAPVVSAGLGRPGDFNGVDVRGKIALIERGEIRFAEKVQNAAAAGAAAVLLYNNTGGAVQGSLATLSRIPAVAIAQTQGVALRRAGNVTARITVKGSVTESTTYNVIGTLPGRGDGVIVFGGHYDSVPAGPGANDNGSGVGASLEAARVLALQGPRNATLRFIAFGGEENGLYGSRHYVESLSREERSRIQAMINLDMVGVGDTWMIGGGRDLQRSARAIAEGLGVTPREMPGDISGASDHASFIAAGIPAVFLYVSDDPNYHSPQDKASFVDPNNLATAGKILVGLIAQLDRG